MEGSWFERAEVAAGAIRNWCGESPDVAIVLGSGLGDAAALARDAVEQPYASIPHWPRPTVAGHAGRLVVGRVGSKRVALLCGRVHAYEGHPLEHVVFPLRVLARLGVRQAVLTSAAGGINTALAAGTLLIVDDHINLLGNPLVGHNDGRFGPRFPDMTEVYSGRLRGIADAAARRRGLTVAHGVYAAVIGPSYETPAEIRYLRSIGADAVGMSLAPEAITARHAGIEVLALSCITNMAAGVTPGPLTHEEVIDTARRSRAAFAGWIEEIVREM